MIIYLIIAAVTLVITLPIRIALWLFSLMWMALLAALTALFALFGLGIDSLRLSAIATPWVAALTLAGLVGMFATVLFAIGWGKVDIEARFNELKTAHENSKVIEIEDIHGQWVGVLSLALTGQAPGPHLTVPYAPGRNSLWYRCLVRLEDSHQFESSLHWQGVDFQRLISAYSLWLASWPRRLYSRKAARQGASTISQMVATSLHGNKPNPNAPLADEIPRKFAAWADGPAMERLFPTQDDLAAAAATHLPVTTGTGARVHGIVLGARALFGRDIAELDSAEILLLAGAPRRPIRPAGLAKHPSDALKTFTAIKRRVTPCLDFIGDPAERERTRRRLDEMKLPAPQIAPSLMAFLPTDARERTRVLSNPVSRANRFAGAALKDVPGELAREFGPDWQRHVGRVRLSTPIGATSAGSVMAEAADATEKQQSGRLLIPLWAGGETATVVGAVVDRHGGIVAFGSNQDAALGRAFAPMGSIAKITAAAALSRSTSAASVRNFFARSYGPPIESRLHAAHTDAELDRIFHAFGWSVPAGQSARHHAVVGGNEQTFVEVLRGALALTKQLAGIQGPTPSPHVVSSVRLVTGETAMVKPSILPSEPLDTILTPARRVFMADVLKAPIDAPVGTLHRQLGPVFAAARLPHWSKTGTANADGPDKLTRSTWVVGGFIAKDQPYAFAVLVTAQSNRRPLGHVVASGTAAPIAAAMLKFTLTKLNLTETGS
jgi:hypothetical protein